ncbi:UbiA prenyltransferase family protein [Phaeodactylibacter luteus]|uniref:UbiA family prenyltransferase n=1 Tax=Phaeodactylibacter luteus TaxID=1564516 RepID=A0A5C6RRP3_9BACT|nr:hypothetical protein [Phaeodactylibacter luteus]TXB64948.1 hypothetical protein FRY97_06910 [Phaeodactylibacter luteus]
MKKTSSAPPPLHIRLFIYAREMFPVWVYLPYVLALYVCMSISVQAAVSGQAVFGSYAYVGMASAFLFMLQMRAFDDLKDLEIDKSLFPWRATPRGLVLKQDLQLLAWGSFSLLIAINVAWAPATLWVFGLTLLYTLLTYKWFFAEAYHREHLFFTMLTHQPLPWAINFYLIHTAMAAQSPAEAFGLYHFVVLAVFSLPITAWEVSRKIRGAGKETQYETFSLLLGPRAAAVIPLACLLAMGGLGLNLGSELQLGGIYFPAMWVLTGAMALGYGRFIIWPTAANNILTLFAMGFAVLFFLNLLAHLLMKYDVQWAAY